MRCFISIEIPKELQREIAKLQKKLPDFKGKFTEFDNLHLTLKFLGDGLTEEQIEKVRSRLKKIKMGSFELVGNKLGVFTEDFIKIVWLHLQGEEMLALQKEIDENLIDLFSSEDRFMSHVTIARVKFVHDKKKFLETLKKINPKNIRFKVSNFKLMKSELTRNGPIYKVIDNFSLS